MNNNIINISENSDVTFSSYSELSKPEEDKINILRSNSNEFNFCTKCEKNPWVQLDLKRIYPIEYIYIYNVNNPDFYERARKIRVEISIDNKDYVLIHDGYIAWKHLLKFPLDCSLYAQFIKISLNDTQYFHLSKIEVTTNINIISYDPAELQDKHLSSIMRYCMKRHDIISYPEDYYPSFERILRILRPFDVKDQRKVRVGGNSDGGYVMIDPKKSNGGTAISLGVSANSPWDLEMAVRGYNVYEFDGTIQHCPYNHKNIHFYKYNVTGSQNPPDGFINFDYIFNELSLKDKENIILQIDIEGYEWELFDSISNDVLKKFKQIIVEFHGLHNIQKHNYFMKIFRKLGENHKVIHFHYNNNSDVIKFKNVLISGLLEITYLRNDDNEFIESETVYPSELDFRNVQESDDIYIGKFSDILSNPKLSVKNVPDVPPEDLYDSYTLNGEIPISYWYFNDSKNKNSIIISNKNYSDIFESLKKNRFNYYGNEGQTFLEAVKKYPIKNKYVAIYGLAGPNCDAFSLFFGAKKIYVIEYNKPMIQNKKVIIYDVNDWEKDNKKVDIAFCYSSFEHDGLGRYGDPLNPNGDIEAMNRLAEHLRDDSIVYFGVPLGADCLVWNTHHIYGPKRLPLLLHNFKLLDVFSVYDDNNQELYPFSLPLSQYIQPLLILQKRSKTSENYLYDHITDYHTYKFLNKKIYNNIQSLLK